MIAEVRIKEKFTRSATCWIDFGLKIEDDTARDEVPKRLVPWLKWENILDYWLKQLFCNREIEFVVFEDFVDVIIA